MEIISSTQYKVLSDAQHENNYHLISIHWIDKSMLAIQPLRFQKTDKQRTND
jgi:hypothetical protein